MIRSFNGDLATVKILFVNNHFNLCVSFFVLVHVTFIRLGGYKEASAEFPLQTEKMTCPLLLCSGVYLHSKSSQQFF